MPESMRAVFGEESQHECSLPKVVQVVMDAEDSKVLVQCATILLEPKGCSCQSNVMMLPTRKSCRERVKKGQRCDGASGQTDTGRKVGPAKHNPRASLCSVTRF